jgi:hypothetical protein
MKSKPFQRAEIISALRRDIWRYISHASRTEDDILLWAGTLMQMSPAELRYLAQLHFILSDPVGRLLEQMPTLIRRLTTTSTVDIETSSHRIRGAIRWSDTYAQRAATGMPHAFVTAPTHRAFDTLENQLLAFALHAIAEFGHRTGWQRSTDNGEAAVVRQRINDATRWLQARALTDLPTHPPSPTTISRVRAGRNRTRYRAALDVVELYERYIARLDATAIRDAVEQRALITRRDPVLLELYCVFDTMRALRRLGWKTPPPNLIGPALQSAVIFRGTKDGASLQLRYQRTPAELSAGSLYRAIQAHHRFAHTGGLIPDLVLSVTEDGLRRWLLIEVKGLERKVESSARAAALDLLGYRRAFSPVLDKQSAPYGLGYVWGSELTPATGSDVTLCTPDTLTDALDALLP